MILTTTDFQTIDSDGRPMEATNQMGPFGIVPEWVAIDSRGTAYARDVYLTLAIMANRSTLECWPSQDTIASRIGCSRSSVCRAIKKLEEIGAISHVQTFRMGSNERGVNRYTVHQVKKVRQQDTTLCHTDTITRDKNQKTSLDFQNEKGLSLQNGEASRVLGRKSSHVEEREERSSNLPTKKVHLQMQSAPVATYSKARAIEFLNGNQDLGHINDLSARIDHAIEYAMAHLPDVKEEPADGVTIRRAALMNLGLLKTRTQILYKASEKTERIYGEGYCLQNLHHDCRAIILEGLLKLDLKSAQFKILSSLWQAPELIVPDVWSRLMQELVLGKADCKRLLYATFFGASFTTQYKALAKLASISEDEAVQRTRDSFLQTVFTVRDRAFERAESNGSVTDAFGQKLKFTGKKELQSAMACWAQSYEVKIMLPVIAALDEREIPVTVWLHDGLYISPEHLGLVPLLKEAAEHEAASLGIDVSLEAEIDTEAEVLA